MMITDLEEHVALGSAIITGWIQVTIAIRNMHKRLNGCLKDHQDGDGEEKTGRCA